MTEFLAAKDQLADVRVDAGYAQGKADQKDFQSETAAQQRARWYGPRDKGEWI